MSSLRWPPAPLPDHDGFQAAPADPGTGPGGTAAPALPTRTARGAHRPAHQRPPSGSGPPAGPQRLPLLPAPSAASADPLVAQGVSEVLALVVSRLDDGAAPATVMPLIRDAARAWAERRARSGMPVPSPADREALAQAVYDQRYGLGPLAAYLRDPAVENIDVNGCDQVWITYATGERVLAPPIAASDDALIELCRTSPPRRRWSTWRWRAARG
jgi:hypothetical protein